MYSLHPPQSASHELRVFLKSRGPSIGCPVAQLIPCEKCMWYHCQSGSQHDMVNYIEDDYIWKRLTKVESFSRNQFAQKPHQPARSLPSPRIQGAVYRSPAKRGFCIWSIYVLGGSQRGGSAVKNSGCMETLGEDRAEAVFDGDMLLTSTLVNIPVSEKAT